MKQCTIVHLHSYIYLPQRCVPAMPCQFQVMDPDRVADCLPECDTLTRNSLLQLTDKIAFSCDYSSFQSILNCGNCLLALCEFENRFNPEAKACVVKYYNEIWPCYRTHFSEWVDAIHHPPCSRISIHIFTTSRAAFVRWICQCAALQQIWSDCPQCCWFLCLFLVCFCKWLLKTTLQTDLSQFAHFFIQEKTGRQSKCSSSYYLPMFGRYAPAIVVAAFVSAVTAALGCNMATMEAWFETRFSFADTHSSTWATVIQRCSLALQPNASTNRPCRFACNCDNHQPCQSQDRETAASTHQGLGKLTTASRSLEPLLAACGRYIS